jgi:restriction system protein
MAKHRKRKSEGTTETKIGIFSILFVILANAADGNKGALVFILLLFVGAAIFFISLKHESFKYSGIEEIDKMDGRTFENYLGSLFKYHGYNVVITQVSGDYGADLIIEKDGRKIVVQAKRYNKNVGIAAIQQVHAAIAFYKANEAWVVTNSGYTEAAHRLAKSNKVRLIGRDELIEMSLQMNKRAALETTKV